MIIILDKKEFKKHLDEFFQKANDPNYVPEKVIYPVDGSKKWEGLINFILSELETQELTLADLAVIGPGCGDAGEIIHGLITTLIKYGIPLEFAFKSLEKARKNWEAKSGGFPRKHLIILGGDAPSNAAEVNFLLRNLLKKKKIKGIIISCQSVLHELPFRSTNDYTHYKFILSLIRDIPNAFFYCREPIGLREYTGEVQLSIPLIENDDLYRFSTIVREKLSFSGEIVKGTNFISLDGSLAGEVIKKLVYFIEDLSVDALLYELGENHTAFDPERFYEILCKLFNKDTVRLEYFNSEKFRRNFKNLKISIESVNNSFKSGIVPKSFAVFTAYKN